jgi:peptide/nickel transport system permease protein
MIAEGRNFIVMAPHISTIPGIALMVTIVGLNLLGDGLRDTLDPRLRR